MNAKNANNAKNAIIAEIAENGGIAKIAETEIESFLIKTFTILFFFKK